MCRYKRTHNGVCSRKLWFAYTFYAQLQIHTHIHPTLLHANKNEFHPFRYERIKAILTELQSVLGNNFSISKKSDPSKPWVIFSHIKRRKIYKTIHHTITSVFLFRFFCTLQQKLKLTQKMHKKKLKNFFFKSNKQNRNLTV